MSAVVSKVTGWEWPADVLEFAAQRKLGPYLEPLLEALQRSFPSARRIKVKLEEDLVVEDHWQVIFDVQIAGLSAIEARASQKAWHREMIRICPSPLLPNFGLFLEIP